MVGTVGPGSCVRLRTKTSMESLDGFVTPTPKRNASKPSPAPTDGTKSTPRSFPARNLFA